MNLLHNMSCPPRTKVVLQGRPVSPRIVIFSLTHALVEARLLAAAGFPKTAGSLTSVFDRLDAARNAVLQRWRTPQDLFACIGDPTFLDVAADFLIGWRPLPAHFALKPLICGNPGLCAGVQARCAGTLYLSRRTPDLTWERLLEAPVAFDDPLVTLS
jgi:hypothetical protein